MTDQPSVKKNLVLAYDSSPYNQVVSVSTSTALTTGAKIGVTTKNLPTADSAINITGSNSADYSSYFFSDNNACTIQNSGSGSAQVLQLVIDKKAPTVTITAPSDTNTSPIPVTITFSENVTGFEATDISVTGGTKGTLSGNGANYSISVTPSGEGTVRVYIGPNVVQDGAGNNNTYAIKDIYYDTIAPNAPTVTSAKATTINTMPKWTWTSGGGGNGIYRYKLDNNDLTSGANDTTTASYTPATELSFGAHTLYVPVSYTHLRRRRCCLSECTSR